MNTRRWLLVVLALCARAASAQSASELLAAINVYRSASQSCDGARTAAAGTLAANTALAGQSIESGDRLLDRLKVHGYRAASAQLIMVSGLTSAGDVMKFIEPRYCRPLTNPLYTEIGVRRDADRWQIVLARPLLSADLRDWREAGQEILRLTNAARARIARATICLLHCLRTIKPRMYAGPQTRGFAFGMFVGLLAQTGDLK